MATYFDMIADMAKKLARVRGMDPDAARYLAQLEAEAMSQADNIQGMRALTAAPQSWLDEAASGGPFTPLERIAAGYEAPAAQEPLMDMILRNERSRALTESRLNRLTPEQRQRSLASVAQENLRNMRDERYAQMARDAERGALLNDAGIAGGGAAAVAAAIASQRAPQQSEASMDPVSRFPSAEDFADMVVVDQPEIAIPGYGMTEDPFATADLVAETRPGPETQIESVEDRLTPEEIEALRSQVVDIRDPVTGERLESFYPEGSVERERELREGKRYTNMRPQPSSGRLSASDIDGLRTQVIDIRDPVTGKKMDSFYPEGSVEREREKRMGLRYSNMR